MKKINNIIWVLVFVFGIVLTSCQKLIEIENPQGKLVSSSIFMDSATANSAVSGMYSKVGNMDMTNGSIGTQTSMYNSLSADEAHYFYSSYGEFTTNSLTPNVYYVDSFWSHLYRVIYNANAIIEGIESSPLPTSFCDRIRGEAKFIRALYYFYLVNEFGAVPLVTMTDPAISGVIPRIDVSEVYEQIVSDLLDAEAHLPTNYEIYGGQRTKATSWAAKALLARVYLFTGEWSKAEDMSTAVINNTALFNLVSDLREVFLPNSREGILQLVPGISRLWTAGVFFPSWGPNMVLNDTLISAFNDDDNRKTEWITYFNYGGEDYPHSGKYRYASSTGTPEYEQVLRLSEQYLIRAEARTQLSKFPQAAADIDVVRNRAGLLDPTTASDKASLMEVIEHERQVELFCEWGHRWLDLKRWPGRDNSSLSRADEVLSAVKGANWQSTDALYPIPQPAITTNTNLVQNEGYN